MSQTNAVAHVRASILLISGVLFLAVTSSAKEKVFPWVSVPAHLDASDDEQKAWFNVDNAELNEAYVPNLLDKTMGTCRGYALDNGMVVTNIHTCGAQFDAQGNAIYQKDDHGNIKKDATGNSIPVREKANFPGPNYLSE